MRWSQAFIPTLRDDPADAEAISHKLLVRGGYIRQLMAGVYSLLPIAYRVREKIRRIVEEEIDRIGGQQMLLSALQPADVWRKSGRWDSMAEEMFQFKDRRGADIGLAMTHEEIMTLLATELTSYRQLPQLWYQIQTKLRDEPRPKSGVLRVREFTMKDSYTLDIDEAGLDKQFNNHHGAYTAILERIGVDPIPVAASSGLMGGSASVEFMVRSDAGEDLVAYSADCGYAANVEKARSRVAKVDDGPGLDAPEQFPTPGIRTIAALAEAGAPADRQIKTLVYVIDGAPVLALLRGDHPLQEQKLKDHTAAVELRPANADEIVDLLGAHPGSIGAVGVSGTRIIADEELRGRRDLATGANEDNVHLRGVDIERDIAVTEWVDLREVAAGEGCPNCDGTLDVFKAIEVGHIFKFGPLYSEKLGATVLDEQGEQRPIYLGSYGFGLERNMAAVIEANHDDKGIIWPASVAPWHVVVTVLKIDDAETMTAGESLYADLQEAGLDVLLDDRDERPGVKFNDSELIGIPYRVTVGPRGLADGVAEVTDRRSGETDHVALTDVVEHVVRVVAG